MELFNLDSDAYKDSEVEQLFHLKQPYTTNEIINAKQKLAQQLGQNSNGELSVEKQREVLFFIDTITTRLLNLHQEQQRPDKQNILTEQGSNFLIENPNRSAGRTAKFSEGRITHSGQVPPGYLNPINVRTITQAISIDSCFRPNYYGTKSTNFSMSLPSIQKNVVSMRVASIELPLTYYAVSRTLGNATFLIIDNDNNPNECWLVTLPDGNYETAFAAASKAFHIENALNNAIANSQPGTFNPTTGQFTPGAFTASAPVSYTVDHISGRSVFSSTAIATPTTFTFRFNTDTQGNQSMETSIQLRLGWQLGFRSAEYITNKNLGPPYGSVVSEGICLVAGPRYGFISIEDYQKNTGPAYIIAYSDSILQDSIISRINLAALQAAVGVYQRSGDPGLTNEMNRTREYFGPVDIQRLQIALYDEFGRVIDLNNMDWSFTLNFERLYE
jgi:hypothetical protein